MHLSLKDRYADVLEIIRDIPEYNRRKAIKRFFLLMDFQDNFLPPGQADSLGAKGHFTRALTAYANHRKIPVRTFFRWYSAYKNKGITGLLPKFGSSCSNHVPRKNHTLAATISIDTRAPLKCLESIQSIIKSCRTIRPDIKESSLAVLQRYFNGLTCRSPLTLSEPLSGEEGKALGRYIAGNHKKHSRKANVILMANEGKTLIEVMEATHTPQRTIYRWLSNFNRDRLGSIQVRVHSPTLETAKAEREKRVIDIIHKMPSLYGINRTTWTYAAICKAYEKEYGEAISTGKIAAVVKSTGYTWRRARVVLTSPDPDYKAKVEKILDTLQQLKDTDRFFFVDEVGPYRVKKYGGQRLSLKDQIETVPAHQRARGKVQFIAALEASSNQICWRFTSDKTAISMARFIEHLVATCRDCTTVYLTWDAISTHNAKAVRDWITNQNGVGQPRIEIVPLPSNAQFLNVIEAVFGGMKRAVICNSDYAGPQEMQDAIAAYFEERNQYYKANPKRAGNKLWDKQSFNLDRLIGGLFKKM